MSAVPFGLGHMERAKRMDVEKIAHLLSEEEALRMELARAEIEIATVSAKLSIAVEALEEAQRKLEMLNGRVKH